MMQVPGVYTQIISSNSITYPQNTGQTSFPYYNTIQQTQYIGTTHYGVFNATQTSPYGVNINGNTYDGYIHSAYLPCNDCNAFHTPLFDYLSMIDTEEEFILLFRRIIKNHYKMKDINTTTIPNYNIVYFADLVSLKSFIKGHFKDYIDLLEGYIAII